MVQLGYANQENKDDDDLPIHYQVFFFSKGLVVGEFCLSILNLKGKY